MPTTAEIIETNINGIMNKLYMTVDTMNMVEILTFNNPLLSIA